MAKALAHDFCVDTLPKKLRRVAVSQIMEPYMRQTSPANVRRESPRKTVWLPRRAIRAGKHQIPVLILRADCEPLCRLFCPMSTENFNCQFGQSNSAPTAMCLGLPERQPTTRLFKNL
jgi:hypothetical protein